MATAWLAQTFPDKKTSTLETFIKDIKKLYDSTVLIILYRTIMIVILTSHDL